MKNCKQLKSIICRFFSCLLVLALMTACAADSGIDKTYVYQIFKGEKKPSRDKLIAIAFGLTLNVEETQRMLKLAGHSELYSRVGRDALILFCIHNGKDIKYTNDALYEHDFPLFSLSE